MWALGGIADFHARPFHKIGEVMSLMDDIKLLANELDNFHLEFISKDQKPDRPVALPDFVTASTGWQVNFTKKSRDLLLVVAKAIHDNDAVIRKAIELIEFEKIIRQCVADFYSEGKFSDISDVTACQIKSEFIEYTKGKVGRQIQEFTHYFPAWTLGMERVSSYTLGPVDFLTRDQWIDSVDIPDSVKDNYLGAKDANFRWKELLREALSKRQSDLKLEGFAGDIYEPIRQCPSVLRISVSGFEKTLSRKLAEMICRSALDATSLIFGSRELFHQQTLASERLGPMRTDSLIQTGGYLWMPGIALSPRIPIISPARASAELGKVSDVLRAIGYTVNALLDAKQHKHPGLASRWTLALNWYAEGSREKDDAIALAKIATSLDVLSHAGTRKGITDLLENLLSIDSDMHVVSGRNPKTLKQFVKKMYDDGRSQILHGSYENRLEAYVDLRSQAEYFARIALLESVVRLETYSGDDTGTAFRSMRR
jgi:hypothetical protein